MSPAACHSLTNSLLAQRSTKEVQEMQGWGCSLHTLTCLLREGHVERCSAPRIPLLPLPSREELLGHLVLQPQEGLPQGHADQCKVLLVFLLPQPRAICPPHSEHQSDGRERKGPALPTATKQSKTQTQS